ncbi:MAG: HAD family hydrolase [Clostridia bacterium]|nr:HAD family hydrolase [Clostridia bacterium]
MNKAVIFDLDGTLLDTLDDLTDSINAMLNEYGYRTLTRDRVSALIGSGAKKLIADALPEKLSDEEFIKRLETYNRIYNASGSPKTKLFGGIKEVLSELKHRGYRLAVLSNKPQHSTDKVAEKYLSGLGFDFIGGQSDKIKCKPDPAGALYVLDKLGVKPENAYLVGDGETDVLAAINAGITGIAALWGNRTKEQLKAAGGTIFADTPKDILKIII